MEIACDLHYFHSLSIHHNGMHISRLMYVDDVAFIGKWLEVNFLNLNRLFHCFSQLSVFYGEFEQKKGL